VNEKFYRTNEKIFQTPTDSRDYENLEKVVQKYEAEIRNHIRVIKDEKIFN
jgi:hypothetical protein